jgi:predicted small metal-binding protein
LAERDFHCRSLGYGCGVEFAMRAGWAWSALTLR